MSFGLRKIRERFSPTYERVILKSWTKGRMTPVSERLFGALKGAHVIHCHQYHVLPTFLAAFYGRLTGARVFVSDLGGAGWTPAYHIDQSRWIVAHLPISRYAAGSLPGRNKRCSVIYGGIDLARYPMRERLDHDGSVVFLGRILPHKGIHYLLEGVPADTPVKVIGPVGDKSYQKRLYELAKGKRVEFLRDLEDDKVRYHLRQAMALVHPTPVDEKGNAGANELFGLAAVEAMASGCVPVLSNAASLPELIEPGRSGLLVPPNDPKAIRAVLRTLQLETNIWRDLAGGARLRAESEYSWDHVVGRCFTAYGV